MDDRSADTRTVPNGCDAPEALAHTTAFELLSRRPRRELLYWLYRRDDRSAPLDVLADALAERDVGIPGDLRVALHHVHLPKLDDADVVDYDADQRTVRYRGDPLLGDLLEWGIRTERHD